MGIYCPKPGFLALYVNIGDCVSLISTFKFSFNKKQKNWYIFPWVISLGRCEVSFSHKTIINVPWTNKKLHRNMTVSVRQTDRHSYSDPQLSPTYHGISGE